MRNFTVPVIVAVMTAGIAISFAMIDLSTAKAEDALSNPVKTCADARAYLDADNSMTMETFKKLLIASGMELDDHANQALEQQCKVTAYVKQVVMIQHLGKREDGSAIAASTQVVMDNGTCRLTKVSFDNC